MARARNEETLRACQLANKLHDLGEPFPVIRDIPLGELAACIADMESALGEIEDAYQYDLVSGNIIKEDQP